MLNYQRYKRVPVVHFPERTWPDQEIQKAPIWCSVDLRDGNQALVEPMVVEEKVEMFNLLVKLGFKEIEVGFPAASQIEFDFLRTLVERKLIPDDVTVQVLVQCREHLIKRTFEALKGLPKAIVHIYNSTSTLQRDVVFHKDKEEIKDIAVVGTKLVQRYAAECDTKVILEYSPESFTGTEIDYALDVCNAVLDIWQPRPDWKVIINLPVTVELSLPHIYASQIEYMSKHMKYRDNVILSLHPHNDRGCGIADTELALLAGADRVEGTLFGNGERTGNVDIITLALNMYTHGVDPKLDFSNLPELTETYERLTRMSVNERQPYSGKLVFAAFSGSHQDAIAKGMHWREEKHPEHWDIPYLPIDPKDVGREYESDVIRINSQSGKGGISYVLEENFGFHIPGKMREDVGYTVKDVSDKRHQELVPKDILKVFKEVYVNIDAPHHLKEVHFVQKKDGGIEAEISLDKAGVPKLYHGRGNGRLDAVSNALKRHSDMNYSIVTYQEHALNVGSDSRACAYVAIQEPNGSITWGAGIHEDIITASVLALISAVNRLND